MCVALAMLLPHVGFAQSAAKGPKAKSKPAKTLDPWGRPEGSIVDQLARYYVWYDREGWHLRTTAKVGRSFQGVIRVKDAKIKSCVSIGLKNDGKKSTDAWKVNEARTELKFAFKTGKLSDGFDLAIEGDEGQVEFELLIDNQKKPKAVFIGEGLQHPADSLFSLPAVPQKMK
jgi:hypothetical protein